MHGDLREVEGDRGISLPVVEGRGGRGVLRCVNLHGIGATDPEHQKDHGKQEKGGLFHAITIRVWYRAGIAGPSCIISLPLPAGEDQQCSHERENPDRGAEPRGRPWQRFQFQVEFVRQVLEDNLAPEG